MPPLPLRILVADDEQLARKRLVRLLADLPAAELAGECASGQEVLARVARADADVDVVLLDIAMPGLSGLETGALLPEDGPYIIFTTAHAEHALAAFDLGAVDYLLKPIDAVRLGKALARARHRLGVEARPAATEFVRLPVTTRQGIRLLDPRDLSHAVFDGELACSWFERAEQNGIPAAQHMTGLCYEAGTHRLADSTAAAGWFHKAAQAGYLNSLCHLGNLMMTGNGIAKDPNKALELCRSAALQGSVPAQIWMGKLYLYGDPTVRNPQDAYQWFLAAAQKHTAEAFYHLGLMLDQGLIESHDAAQPRQLFEQAASLKHIPAYFQAGKQFFAAEPDSETNRLSAEHLAKAYLWSFSRD